MVSGARKVRITQTCLVAGLGNVSLTFLLISVFQILNKVRYGKSWDIALGPLKQVPMNMFIMWMAGNTISIFPIMMVGMMFFRPVQALMSAQNTAFKMIEGNQAAVQKFVYFLGNFLCLGLAVYKCQGMGLLPTTTSDWLAFVEPQKRLEWSGGGAML